MSFSDLKISELKKVAESFSVDLDGSKTKQEIIALLEEEGVSYQMYSSFSEVEKEEVEVPEIERRQKKAMSTKASKENTLLVRMVRDNFSYQALGYTFSQEHPFVAMPEDDAQRIFDTQDGFRPATPKEAQEFYA